VTSAAGDLVVDFLSQDNTQTPLPTGPQTVVPGMSGQQYINASYLLASGASTTMAWTLGTSANWVQSAISIKHN
jgi:hypothetical protein